MRRSIASELHRLIEAARPLAAPTALEPALAARRQPTIRSGPTPHDLRFDFEATAEGAEWIDDLGHVAIERRRRDAGDPVIGHFDWRVQNLAFDGDRVVAIYDWDSLALASEPAIVGQAAGGFPIDWRVDHPDPPPTLDEMRAFVADYERARGAAVPAERARSPRRRQPGDDHLRRALPALGPAAPTGPGRQRSHRLAPPPAASDGERCFGAGSFTG